MEEIWGEDEVAESHHHFDTLAREGFRHGKLSSNDANRQAGFNHGFNLGRAMGIFSGHFLAVLNHPKIPEHVNESAKEVILSISPDTMEENFQKLDVLLGKSPDSVIAACSSFKGHVRKALESNKIED